jgi:hypothetical protein
MAILALIAGGRIGPITVPGLVITTSNQPLWQNPKLLSQQAFLTQDTKTHFVCSNQDQSNSSH